MRVSRAEIRLSAVRRCFLEAPGDNPLPRLCQLPEGAGTPWHVALSVFEASGDCSRLSRCFAVTLTLPHPPSNLMDLSDIHRARADNPK